MHTLKYLRHIIFFIKKVRCITDGCKEEKACKKEARDKEALNQEAFK